MLAVYGLTCTCPKCDPNEIRYVGKTSKGAANRLKTHASESRNLKNNLPKSRWIRKHGEGHIKTVELQTASEEWELEELERGWIQRLGTFGTPRGLNLTEGGEGVSGYTFSAAARERFRERTREQFELKHPRKKLTDGDATAVRRRLWDGERPEEVHREYPHVTVAVIKKLEQAGYRPGIPFPDRPRTLRDPEIGLRGSKTRSRFERGELPRAVAELYATGEFTKTRIAETLGVSCAAVTKYTKGLG